MKRIKGLDTLRFVLAMIVVFGHTGFLPLHSLLGVDNIPGRIIRSLERNASNGPAAVIAFFVISGFCIHYPFRTAQRIDLLSFYSRRHIRILGPVLVAIALAHPLGITLWRLSDSVLWSLVCEEVHYTIYPLLLIVRTRFGTPRLVAISFVAALVLVAASPHQLEYPTYGPFLNAVLGLLKFTRFSGQVGYAALEAAEWTRSYSAGVM